MAVYDDPKLETDDLEKNFNAPAYTPPHERPVPTSPEVKAHQERMAKESGAPESSESGGKSGGLFNPHGDKDDSSGKKGVGLGPVGVGMAGEAASLAASSTPVGAVAKGFQFFLGSSKRKKRSAVTSIIVAAVVGGGFFGVTTLSGPFEFIHIAQLLTHLNLSTNQNESGSRMEKLIRDVRYHSQNKAYKTNLNYLGNKLADRFEAKLNAEGLTSSYTKYFGLKEGYFVDRNYPDYKNKTFAEIEEKLHEKYGTGFKVVQDSTGRIMIEQPTGYRASLKLVNGVLTEADYNGLSSAIGARVMGTRDGITWHPLKKLDAKLFKTLAEKLAAYEKAKDTANLDGATNDINASDGSNQKDPKATQQNANDTTGQANETIGEANSAGGNVGSGNDTGVTTLSDHIGLKIGLGGAAAAAILCIAQGIAKNADNIKEAQLILPATRMGMRAITEGNQVEFGGGDIDTDQLKVDSQQLYDPTTKTSWDDALSIRAMEGLQGGLPPSNTLQNAGNGSPFDFLLTGAFGTVLAPICSTAGQVALTLVSFLGGPFSALGSLIVGAALGPPIFSALAHWMAGDAADITAKGGAFGNIINFGAHFGANDQALSGGGVAMTPAQNTQLVDANNDESQAEFDQHNLAYRLFSPTDYRSVFASFLDHQTPQLTTNVENALFAFLGLGHTLTNTMATVFSGVAHAQAGTYDFGNTPTLAMSADEMSDPAVANPYANGDAVADILSGPNGPAYITQAQQCFGDTLAQVPDPAGDMVWDVQFGTSAINIYSVQYKNLNPPCINSSDKNWLRIRFFIFDTLNLKSTACYEGDDQSCSDIGLGGSINTPTTTGGFTDPFPDGWAAGRLDLGYDGQFTKEIVSPCDGKMTYVDPDSDHSSNGGWEGAYFVVQCSQVISGLPSNAFYFAEGVSPTVTQGQSVTAGQQIGVPGWTGYSEGPGGIEWGLAVPNIPRETYAASLGDSCSVGSPSQKFVLSFAQWVQQNLQVHAPSSTDHAGCA